MPPMRFSASWYLRLERRHKGLIQEGIHQYRIQDPDPRGSGGGGAAEDERRRRDEVEEVQVGREDEVERQRTGVATDPSETPQVEQKPLSLARRDASQRVSFQW